MKVKVLDVKKIDRARIKALAVIELEGIGKVTGIKVIQGDYNLYCCPANQSYVEGES